LINNDKNEKYFLDYDISIKAFKLSGILHAEPLKIFKSYEEAIKYKLGFNTTIPEKLGLNFIGINKAEGIVIKSMKGRYVVKIKIEEFSEFQYSENNFIKITDKDFNIKQMCLNNLTENRLNTAISKIGNFNENREEIFELLSEDILSEVNGFHVYELKEWLDQMIREKFKNGTTPFQII